MEIMFEKNFPGLFRVATNGNYMLAEMVQSSFTARERSDQVNMQLNIFARLH